jgi:hypothetical protein
MRFWPNLTAMKIPMRWNRDSSFVPALALAFLVGLFLRLYLLSDQVLIDDEWHGLYYVIGKSPWWLLTHFSIPGATCIPLNFYDWLLGATVGWSELMLRLPSLVCGLSCVLICPLLARKLIGASAAILLAFLLAISPVLIFTAASAGLTARWRCWDLRRSFWRLAGCRTADCAMEFFLQSRARWQFTFICLRLLP